MGSEGRYGTDQPGFVHHYNVVERSVASGSVGPPPAPPASSAPATPRLGYEAGPPKNRLEAENLDLRSRLEDCENELFAEQRRRAEVESKHLELQASSNVRVLEGKVAGLQAMLEEKSRENEKSRSQGSHAQHRIDDGAAKLQHLGGVVDELENRMGHQHVRMQEMERDLEKERTTVQSLERTLEEQYKKAQRQKISQEDAMNERDNLEAEVRAELRLKNRQLQDGEMARLSAAEEVQNLHCDLEAARQRLQDQEATLQALRERCTAAESNLEQVHGEDAQRRVVTEGLKQELERENAKVHNMLSDLRAAECQRIELEERARCTEQEVTRLHAAEENAKYLEDSLQRVEEDVRCEIKQHSETRQRLRDAEERLAASQTLQTQLAQVEGELAAKGESLARMHETTERHSAKVAALQAELDESRNSTAAANSELTASIEHQRSMETRMAHLEEEAGRAASFDTKVRSYEEVLQTRQEELRQANAENAKLQIAIREMEHKLQEIGALDERVHGLVRDKQDLEHELNCQQRGLARSEAECSSLTNQLENANYTLDTERSMTAELQQHVEELHRKLQAKGNVEARLAEAQHELDERARELSEERSSLGSHVSRCRHLEADLEGALERQRSIEENFQKQTQTVETLQLQLGKQSVAVQEGQREAVRLGADLHTATEGLAETKDALARSEALCAQQTKQLEALHEAETQLTTSGDALRAETTRLTQELSEKSRALDAETERLRTVEERLVGVEAEAVRCSTLEGKVQALQEVNAGKTKDIDTLQAQLLAVRAELCTAEEGVAQSVQMEDRIRDLRMQIAKQVADMERLETDESRKAAALAEARKELERLSDAMRAKERSLEEERARGTATTERVQRLEAAAAARSSLEGKIAGLEILAESKETELRAVSEETTGLRQRVRDLEQQLHARLRVEDVVQETQLQLQIKNDAIARLELEEKKRRLVAEDQHRELLSLNDKVRQAEGNAQEQSAKRLEADARVQELLREADLRSRAEEGEHRERLMQAERLEAECRDSRDRLLGTERAARASEQRSLECQNDATRVRAQLQRAEDEKDCLAQEAAELRAQLNADRAAAHKLTTDVASLESELRIQKDREERTARSMGDDVREAKQRFEAKIATLEQRLFETENVRDVLEKDGLKLREELAYANNAMRSKSMHSAQPGESYQPSGSAMQLPPASDTGSIRESDYESDLRNREDRLASEWERTKEVCSIGFVWRSLKEERYKTKKIQNNGFE